MNYSVQQAVGAPAVREISKFDDASVGTGEVETITEPSSQTGRESLSENFLDEIDAWARRALAMNGFGDYP
jgi:hypothetical protein